MPTKTNYFKYHSLMAEIADYRNASAVLQWDQETYMPVSGNFLRGRQIATLNQAAHEKFTSPKTYTLLNKTLDDTTLSDDERKNVEITLEDYKKLKKIPPKFVHKQSVAVAEAFTSWNNAKQKSKFKIFEKSLKKIVDLKKTEADLLGYEKHPYNALLDTYEKNCTVAQLDDLFNEITLELKPILNKVLLKQPLHKNKLNYVFDEERQWKLSLEVLEKIGFDFTKGRQDKSSHPFTTSFGSHDVRLTTRIDTADLCSMIYSCIHECGHGLYEQGFSAEMNGLPIAEAASIGMHESQSRIWENNIGRSKEFIGFLYPIIKKYFSDSWLSEKELYQEINYIEPSLIRTEADEITYHYHIIVRYEIEKNLIDNTIKVNDIPGVWAELYNKYLEIRVPNDSKGCLQDIHWSHGSFGYFPTYSIGSLMAAQLMEQIKNELPGTANDIAFGNFKNILAWLRANVHSKGRLLTSNEILSQATNKEFSAQSFINYLKLKFL